MCADFNLDQRLNRARDRGLGIDVPIPLHERVDALCEIVYDAGYERPTKSKMIAALLLAATDEPEQLDKLLRAYDRARVEDSIAGKQAVEGNIVTFPQRRRGPRRSDQPA